MCSIAGIVDFQAGGPIEVRELEAMASALAHRGPDGLETFVDRKTQLCGLAHTRLAVIDPAHGDQPLCNEDESLWITYNGECYNFPQLRRELEQAGHRFKTRCDTEVVLHLFEQYGPDCVDHIRGMFALAVWDSGRRRLFLARDRMGQKPLYYAVQQGRFLFGSECKAILRTRAFPRRPDLRAIMQYLLLQYVPAGMSAFADIKSLPPGHRMTVDADNWSDPNPQRYWSIPSRPDFAGTMDDACAQLRHELTEATRMRMISDVPLGAFLSGGIDSTIVVGLMSQIDDKPVETCSVGFRRRRYNELSHARHVAQRFQCEHSEYMVEPNSVNDVRRLSYFYDEPFADCSALPAAQLSLTARSRVTVALTGDGGDECFGGYDRYRALLLAERMAQSRLLRWLAGRRFWERLAGGEHHGRVSRLQRLLSAVERPTPQRYLKWISVFEPDLLRELFDERQYDDRACQWQWHQWDGFFDPAGRVPYDRCGAAAQAMLLDGMTYLPGDLNTKIDRASMAVGLELRCPFQDHKVVELAYSLPAAWRHNGRVSKLILRQACADLVPGRINRRAKMGFGVPVGAWFRKELRELFVDTVLSGRAAQRGYFHRRTIERLLAENDRRRADHGHRLWALLMLELWHQQYIDG